MSERNRQPMYLLRLALVHTDVEEVTHALGLSSTAQASRRGAAADDALQELRCGIHHGTAAR